MFTLCHYNLPQFASLFQSFWQSGKQRKSPRLISIATRLRELRACLPINDEKLPTRENCWDLIPSCLEDVIGGRSYIWCGTNGAHKNWAKMLFLGNTRMLVWEVYEFMLMLLNKILSLVVLLLGQISGYLLSSLEIRSTTTSALHAIW